MESAAVALELCSSGLGRELAQLFLASSAVFLSVRVTTLRLTSPAVAGAARASRADPLARLWDIRLAAPFFPRED